jgi:hypothetical protein
VIKTSHVTKNPQRECITLDRTPLMMLNRTEDAQKAYHEIASLNDSDDLKSPLPKELRILP